MGLGALSCPTSHVRDHSRAISGLIERYELPHRQELKWTKVGPSNVDLYCQVLQYFFAHDDLSFRVIVADKRNLNHSVYSQTHDEWYYKLYFRLLEELIDPKKRYNVYVDIKDSLGAWKTRKLRTILSNAKHDFDQVSIQRLQQIRSNESRLMQVADVLIGTTCYAQHHMRSAAKSELVENLKQLSGYQLTLSTVRAESKFNIFHWSGNSQ